MAVAEAMSVAGGRTGQTLLSCLMYGVVLPHGMTTKLNQVVLYSNTDHCITGTGHHNNAALLPYCSPSSLPLLTSDCNRTAALPHCHIAALPRCHIATLPHCRTAMLPCCHTATLPHCHAHRHAATLPCCHSAPSPLYHSGQLP